MPRNIKELFSGRKKISDKPISFPTVLTLINNLTTIARVNVNCSLYGQANLTFSNKEPVEVAEMLQEKMQDFLSNPSRCYCEANHSVYAGKKDARHYIDLSAGNITVKIGTEKVNGYPCVKVTLDYIV